MNCNKIKEKMWDYLLDDTLPQELQEHFAHCSDCSAEFEQLQQTIQTLKPKIKVHASDNFSNNIIKKLNKEDKKMKKTIPFYLKVAAVLVLLTTSLFTILFTSNSHSVASASTANQIFLKSILTLSQSSSMRIEMKIRTLKGDNFELIGADYGFVKHKIKVQFANPKKWIIEKSGRTVLCDGQNTYLDIQNQNHVLKADNTAGFVGWLNILFTPEKILEIEKERSLKDQSNYIVKENKDQLILTVYSKAQGDFTNDYLKNSSVTESDTKRVFCFDKSTYQLLSFKLYVIQDKKEVLIMKTTKIKYDEVFDEEDFDAQIFGDKKIRNIEDLNPEADEILKTKTPEEIARYFFEACANKEWEKAEKVCPWITDGMKEYLAELEIVKVGTSFKSGLYRGTFIPYTIKLKSGDIKDHNLAIRNDNSEKMWVLDGGI